MTSDRPKIWYRCVEHDTNLIELEPRHRPREEMYRFICQEAAEKYYDIEAYDDDWPLTFTLHLTKDGPAVAEFLVHLDLTPSFTAYSQQVTEKT